MCTKEWEEYDPKNFSIKFLLVFVCKKFHATKAIK